MKKSGRRYRAGGSAGGRRPRCAASKRKPGADAGNCSTPWRTSTTRWPRCMPALPPSTKARRRSTLAQAEFDRRKQLLAQATVCRERVRSAASGPARPRSAEVVQALAGCPSDPRLSGIAGPARERRDLGQVPPDLDQTFSSVRQAQAAADPERGAARRHPFVRPDAEGDARGIRETGPRRYRPHLRRTCGRGAGRQAGRGQARSRQARSRSGASSTCATATSSPRSTASSRAAMSIRATTFRSARA